MKLSFCLEMLYTDIPFIERLRVAKKAGIESFEFWDWRNKDISALMVQMQATGMTLSNLSGNRNFGMIDSVEREDFLDEVRETANIGKKLGCPTLMLLVQKLLEPDNAGKLPDTKLTPQEIEKNIIDCGIEVGKIADGLDLNIVIEPLNDVLDHPNYLLKSSEMAFRIIKAIDHPRVKLLYDIYHLAMQNENVMNDIEKNLDLIGYFHVADKPGRNEPGTGIISYPEILSLLKSMNYQGVIGFEFMPKNGNSPRAVRSILDTFA